ncbi:MAG TPA: universal stress protein [Ignavibacteriaceae bacterium]|nr:universal stress protein [Ignavibacteriaceae bacterium]
MKRLQNILVPTDFSINSVAALDYANNLAKGTEALIHIMHIVENFKTSTPKRLNDKFIPDPLILERIKKDIKRFVTSVPELSQPIIDVIRFGKPYDQILNYSKDKKIDLIVMTTHGDNDYPNSILGIVSEKVAKYSDVPVVLIKTDQLSAIDEYRPNYSANAENYIR